MNPLAERWRQDEQMDADDLPAEDFAAVLADLARVNRLTLAGRPTLAFLARASQGRRRLKILDVGFGQGDMLRSISAWAMQHKVTVELIGIDLNPKSASIAQAATPAGMAIDYRTGDYADLAGAGWDVIVSSLVTHHMDETQIDGFLRFMEREARVGWMVNDLHRHRFAFTAYPLLARAMRWHPIVRADGRLSIARAFRPAEWHAMLTAAGVQGARIVRRFPFRLCVERTR